jgi:acetylornithine/succinyldiaminopimelate/putrescine aminotransferase
VLDVVEAPAVLASVLERGAQLAAGLHDLGLEGVRGRGLMLAFEHPDAPALVRRALLEHRLVVNATGPTTVRLVPALTLTAAEADEGLARLRAALAAQHRPAATI